MKKLMITAAAVALGATSFAELCDIEQVGGCSVYNVKFTFKTLQAKKACDEGAKWLIQLANNGQNVWYRTTDGEDRAAQANAGAGVAVRPIDYIVTPQRGNPAGSTPVINAGRRPVYWMDNGTRKFEGILWQCNAACFEGAAPWSDVEINAERINFAMWEKKTGLALTFPILQAKIGIPNDNANGFEGTPTSVYFSFNEEQRFQFLGRYGKTAQKVGAFWNPRLRRGFIGAAGFGSFDAKNLRIKSISGNAVGMIAPITDGLDVCGDRDSFFCAVGFMCAQWRDWCCDGCYAGVQLVPASGTWSLKYNASATKKANSDKVVLTDLVPAYMMYATASEYRVLRDLDPNLHTDGCYWIASEASPAGATVAVAQGAMFYKGGTGTDAEFVLGDALNAAAEENEKVFNINDAAEYLDADGKLKGWIIDIAYDKENNKLVVFYYAATDDGKVAVNDDGKIELLDEELEVADTAD